VNARVSVVIPAYNMARYIRSSIESVLTQTRPPDEVIVVDDGSSDLTAKVVEDLATRVQLLRQDNMGYAVAMNRGIQASTGSLLAFQDADDLWEREKLERQCAAMDANPSVDAVFGHMACFLSPDVDPQAARRYRVPPVMAAYQLTTMLIRRRAFERVGALDPGAETAVVIEWISRARAADVRMLMLDALLVRRRIHDSNMGIRKAAQRNADLIAALRTHRRRMGRSQDQPEA
jgi:glycosyltransferase involved in cell wall biosynthesis